MKKSSTKSQALPELQRVPKDRIELAARYFATSNMAVLDRTVKPCDLKTLQRMVDVAYDRAVEGTMDGLAVPVREVADAYESKAYAIVNKEVTYWRKLIKSHDHYCLETLQKEVPFIFEAKEGK